MSEPWWYGERWYKMVVAGEEALKKLLDAGKTPACVVELKSFDYVIIPKGDDDPEIKSSFFIASNGERPHFLRSFWIDGETIDYHDYYILCVPKGADERLAGVERKPAPAWLSNGCQD